MKKRPEYSLTKTGERIRKLRKQKRISVEQIRRYLQLEKLFEVSPFEILVEKNNCEQITRVILEYMRLRIENCIREMEYIWIPTSV